MQKFNNIHKNWVILIIQLIFLVSFTYCQTQKLLYVPIDERFATRGNFLNLASLVGIDYQILTPPLEIICQLKKPGNVDLINSWVQENLKSPLFQKDSFTLIVSSEMMFYGGLINSRISNETTAAITPRIQFLNSLQQKYGNKLSILLSAVVMRIPAYNGDFEEPWYWSLYGYNLYQYSFFLDQYELLKNIDDFTRAFGFKSQVPESIVLEFEWRRQRNYNVTSYIMEIQQNFKSFDKIWITLDDNAQYGFNQREQRNLRKLISDFNLTENVNIYPGADEVALTMLAKAITMKMTQKQAPKVAVVYRNSSSKNLIPNYEGQPLNVSVVTQITAGGGIITCNDDLTKFDAQNTDIVVLVNNWDQGRQGQAPNAQIDAIFDKFDQFINFWGVVVLADVRFSNGGDIYFNEWIVTKIKNQFGLLTYAGWNTAGNTLGNVISNGLILSVYKFQTTALEFNQIYTYYRLIEDVRYQVYVRNWIRQYMNRASLDQDSNLAVDLNFYETFSARAFYPSLRNYTTLFSDNTEYQLSNVYYPWNRTFEIGFQIQHQSQSIEKQSIETKI